MSDNIEYDYNSELDKYILIKYIKKFKKNNKSIF